MQNPTFMDRLLQVTTFIVLLWFAFLCSTDASSVDTFTERGMVYVNETSIASQEIAYVAPSEWRLMTSGLEVFDNETASEIVDDLYGFSGLEKRQNNRIVYAAKVGTLAIGGLPLLRRAMRLVTSRLPASTTAGVPQSASETQCTTPLSPCSASWVGSNTSIALQDCDRV